MSHALQSSLNDERYETVRRAVEVMWEHIDEPLPLRAIAVAVHCSERTLCARFSSYHGVGPLRYFRIQRLHAVRRELCSASGRTISDIAFGWGFNHLGRFCHDYRSLFGETPSVTRRDNLLA